jgi:outer membrane protein OmpA-like peptidoglycan-associated protein
MKARSVLALLLAFTLGSGCAWWGERGRTTKGAVYGTGAGAAAGAAIGGILGGGEGAWKGAAVGAAVGGLSGGLIGNYMDRQAREMQQVLARQDRLEREGETLRASLSSDVLFDSGSAKLHPGGEDKIRDLAQVLQRYPRTRVEVVGHTDSQGSEQFNQELSERRATSVRDVLVRAGVAADRVGSRGAGELRPVATNESREGRAMNRRVEVVVRPDEGLVAEQREQQRGAPSPAYDPYDEPH